jgi:hypothetical protein
MPIIRTIIPIVQKIMLILRYWAKSNKMTLGATTVFLSTKLSIPASKRLQASTSLDSRSLSD